MKHKSVLIAFLFCIHTASAQNEWTLQPWVEVFGTVNGRELGKFVTGLDPQTGFPFRAGVSEVGKTGIYRLQSTGDTSIQTFFSGEQLLQGDLDGDGIKDYIVRKVQGEVGVDTVYVYKGQVAGPDSIPIFKMASEKSVHPLLPLAIGDLDGDGINDLIISDNFSDTSRGKIYMVWGPIQQNPIVTFLYGDSVRYELGLNAVIEDINDDGKNDLIVRGTKYTNAGPPTDFGYVNIYWGNGNRVVDTLGRTQMRTNLLSYIGLACFDINGDGKPDLLWTTNDTDNMHISVHYGKQVFSAIPDLRMARPSGVGNFGASIINAGDMNGDGYNDAVVAAPRATITSGFVFVFSGGPSMDGKFDAAVGQSTDSDFGRSVASLGDATGDGLAELVVGAWNYDFSTNKGYWGIFKGSVNIPVSVFAEGNSLPESIALLQPYPNPFNPMTVVRFSVTARSNVSLQIFDALGRQIQTLVSEEKQPGEYSVQFDGSGLPSGTYYCRMTAISGSQAQFQQTKKIVLIK